MLIWAPSDVVPPGLRVLSGTEADPRVGARQQGLRRCCQEWWLSAVAWLWQVHAVAACAPEQQPPTHVQTAVTFRGQARIVEGKSYTMCHVLQQPMLCQIHKQVFCNVKRSMGPDNSKDKNISTPLAVCVCSPGRQLPCCQQPASQTPAVLCRLGSSAGPAAAQCQRHAASAGHGLPADAKPIRTLLRLQSCQQRAKTSGAADNRWGLHPCLNSCFIGTWSQKQHAGNHL